MEPLALPIRARFVPLRGHPNCSPDWYMPCIPAGGFSAVLLQLGGGLVVFVPAAGAGCRIGPRPPIEAATEAAAECAPPLGLDPAEPVAYLSWTGDAPVVMYPPYSCAGDRPEHEAEVPACGCSERDSRPAAVEPSNRTGCTRRLRVRCSVRLTDATSCDFTLPPAETRHSQPGFRTGLYRPLPV